MSKESQFGRAEQNRNLTIAFDCDDSYLLNPVYSKAKPTMVAAYGLSALFDIVPVDDIDTLFMGYNGAFTAATEDAVKLLDLEDELNIESFWPKAQMFKSDDDVDSWREAYQKAYRVRDRGMYDEDSSLDVNVDMTFQVVGGSTSGREMRKNTHKAFDSRYASVSLSELIDWDAVTSNSENIYGAAAIRAAGGASAHLVEDENAIDAAERDELSEDTVMTMHQRAQEVIEAESREVTDISRVGESKAAALAEAGIESVEEIRAASVEELTEADGVADALAEHIISEVESSPLREDSGSEAEAETSTTTLGEAAQ
jgi:hypothetical protein